MVAVNRNISPHFLPHIKQSIPLTQHMGITDLYWDNQALKMHLALPPLVNDKGTGFGGGIAAAATLLGWCHLTLLLQGIGQISPVVVGHSQNQFKRPITSDLVMTCQALDADSELGCLQDYMQGRRARLTLEVQVIENKELAFWYQGQYIALGNTSGAQNLSATGRTPTR